VACRVASWAVGPALAAVLGSGCLELELDPTPADQDAEQIGTGQQSIVGGVETADFPSAGMLLVGGTPDVGAAACSVTLIGCDKILTAAHCVCERFGSACSDTVPALPFYVFFQHAGFFRVKSVEVHPDYNDTPAHDAAVLTLVEPVTGIRPTRLASAPVPLGSPAVIAGFGRAGGDSFEYGIKRRGDVTVSECSPGQGPSKLCWLFDGSDDSSSSNVCHGDSGGSTFVQSDGVYEVAGVHSTTNQLSCLEDPDTRTSTDTAVFDHLDFLAARAPTPPEQCGELPRIGDPGVISTFAYGTVDRGAATDLTVEVPPGSAELRVAMNSSDGNGSNLNLYLMAGAPAGPGRFDCSADGDSPHGFCGIHSPAPGTWHIQVYSYDGFDTGAAGEFEVVSTTFPGAPIGHDDWYSVYGTRPYMIGPSAGVLLNDEESARPGLSAVLDKAPRHGHVSLSASGGFVYEADAGYVGHDAFRYRASDGTYSGVATVDLDVKPGPEDEPFDYSAAPHAGCAAGGGSGGSGAALLLVGLVALRRRRRTR